MSDLKVNLNDVSEAYDRVREAMLRGQPHVDLSYLCIDKLPANLTGPIDQLTITDTLITNVTIPANIILTSLALGTATRHSEFNHKRIYIHDVRCRYLGIQTMAAGGITICFTGNLDCNAINQIGMSPPNIEFDPKMTFAQQPSIYGSVQFVSNMRKHFHRQQYITDIIHNSNDEAGLSNIYNLS